MVRFLKQTPLNHSIAHLTMSEQVMSAGTLFDRFTLGSQTSRLTPHGGDTCFTSCSRHPGLPAGISASW